VTCVFVGDVLNHEKDISNIYVGADHVQSSQVDDSVLPEKEREAHQSNQYLDMCIVGPWRDAITDLDYIHNTTSWSYMISSDEVVADSLLLGDHVTQTLTQEPFGRALVATDSNLSNFNANVIHDMQVLWLVSTKAQQTRKFLSESW